MRLLTKFSLISIGTLALVVALLAGFGVRTFDRLNVANETRLLRVQLATAMRDIDRAVTPGDEAEISRLLQADEVADGPQLHAYRRDGTRIFAPAGTHIRLPADRLARMQATGSGIDWIATPAGRYLVDWTVRKSDGLTVAAALPEAAYVAARSRYLWAIGLTALAALGLGIVVSLVVARRFSSRAGATVRALESIRAGEYGVRLAADGGRDELSIIQQRIDEMADLFARRAQERDAAAKWLQESEKRFRDFAEATADAFWETDAELRYTWFHNRGRRFSDIPDDNAMIGTRRGDYFRTLLPTSEHWQSHLDDLENHRPFRNFPFSAVYEDGREFHRVSSGTPFFDDDGNFAGYRGTSTDVTAYVEAERRLRNLVANIPGLVYQRLIHPDGRMEFTYLSGAAERLFGPRAVDDDGKTVASLEYIHPDDRERVRQAIIDGARSGQPSRTEFRHLLPDGRMIWMQINNAAATRRPDGVLVQDGFSVDITSLKDAERDARLAEDRLLGFMRTASDSLWETDAEHRLAWFSDAERPRLRYLKIEDMIGLRRWEYPGIVDTEGEAWQGHHDDMASHRPFRDFVFELRTPEGRSVFRRISGDPMFDETGAFTGYRGVSSDVTERVLADREAHAAQQRLIDAIQSSDQGVAIFDADDRLIFVNDAFRHLQSLFADLFVVGRKFEEILREAAERDQISAVTGGAKNWIEQRLAYHRNPQGLFTTFRLRGNLVQVRDERLDDGGCIIHLTDVTEQTEARNALHVSEERFRSFVESSADWMWETDDQHRITWISESLGDHSDIPIAHFTGKTRWDALGFSLDIDDNWRHLAEAMDAHRTIREFRFSRPDSAGRMLHRVVNGAPIFDERGAFIGYRGTVSDTTELIEAQQRARDTEERFVEAVNSADVGLMLFDPDDKLVFSNHMARQILDEAGTRLAPGASFEDLVLKFYESNPQPPPYDDPEEARARRRARHRNPDNTEPFTVYRSDGLILEIKEELLPDGSVILFQNDITARRTAEEALRVSEQRFRDFAEASSDWLWETDSDLRFIWHSADEDPSESTGRPAVGQTPWEYLGADVSANEQFREHMETMLAHRPFRDFRYPKVLPTGAIGHRSVSGTPYYDAEGMFLGYRGTTTDITERVEAEQQYRTLIEQSPVPMIVHRGLKLRYVNAAALRMFGADSPDRLVGQSMLDFVHPDDHKQFVERMEEVLQQGTITELSEQRRLRLDGSEILVMSRGVPVMWEGERSVLGTHIDITDRVKAERQYRQLIENAPMAITIDDGKNFLFSNQAFAELMGAGSPAEVVGRPLTDMAHAEDLDKFHERIRQVSKFRQTAETTEIKRRRFDGKTITVLTRGVPIVWEGEPATMGMQVDISDRIAAQQALRDSEERFRNLVEGSRQGVLLHVDYRPVFANAALVDMFGYDSTADVLALESVLDLVAPEEWERWRNFRDARLGGLEAPESYEFAGVKKDGSRIWLHMTVRVVAWEGRTALQGTMIDITEQRTAVEAIRDSEERFRVLTAMSPVAVFVTDADGNCEYINEAFQNMSGLTPDVAAGRGWLSAIHPADRDRIASEWEDATRLNKPFRSEFRFSRPDGAVVWGIAQAAAQRDVGGAVVNYIGAITDVTARRETEEALESSEERFRMLTMLSPVGVFLTNPEGDVEYVNEAMSNMLGMPAREATGRNWIKGINPDDRRKLDAAWSKAFGNREVLEIEIRMGDGSGDDRWALMQASPLRAPSGKHGGYVGAVTDITDRRIAEDQLRQVQKMDAIGQLTGGIAHDFNNLLAIVQGNLELLRERASEEQRVQSLIDAAFGAARRGATLNQRLLAFARRQPLRPEKCDINAIVREMAGLFVRTLGENVELRAEYAAGLWPASVDPNGLETALLNLAINARDAMPDGGLLTITTANASFGDGRAPPTKDLPDGDYVLLQVSDTGTGMDQATMEQAFDPFFTTKDTGRGSGLGLSMVYGFARQSGGHVTIESVPGEGTSITLFFPREPGDAPVLSRRAPMRIPAGGGERILVVEDDVEVRDLVVGMFASLNYRTLEAANAREALRILDDQRDIELLFTDVLLGNGETGPDLAREARQKYPGLRVLFTSGYAKDGFEGDNPIELGALINKPYERVDLARAVRAALDTGRA